MDQTCLSNLDSTGRFLHQPMVKPGASLDKTFRQKLRSDWKQNPICEHTESRSLENVSINTCACQHPFYRTASMKLWMQQTEQPYEKSNIERLLEDGDLYKKPSDHPKSIIEGDKECIIVFSILLSQKHGKLIYVFRNAGVCDNNLKMPISPEKLGQELRSRRLSIPNVGDIITDFEREKWKFFPACLKFDMEEDLAYNIRLPFSVRRLVNKKGGTASVLQVLVHEDFVVNNSREQFGQPIDSTDFGKCYELALKVYSSQDHNLYQREVDVYKSLPAQREIGSIVRYFGCYSHHDGQNKKTHNIILEYGKKDLSEYFCELYPPESSLEIYKFWQSLCEVSSAITSIHKLSHEKDFYNGWHGDIKPDNILLVGEHFKLVDFGFTEFKKVEEESRDPPRARLRGGTDAYGAPELFQSYAIGSNIAVTQKIDSWSFGCVLSEAATWIVLGYKGIVEYRELRLLASKGKYSTDAFHNGSEVLPAIKSWHNYLRSVMRRSDLVTSQVLDLIDSTLLIGNANARLTSVELNTELDCIISSVSSKKNALAKADDCVLKALLSAEGELEEIARESRDRSMRRSLEKRKATRPTSTSYRKETIESYLYGPEHVSHRSRMMSEVSLFRNTTIVSQDEENDISRGIASKSDLELSRHNTPQSSDDPTRPSPPDLITIKPLPILPSPLAPTPSSSSSVSIKPEDIWHSAKENSDTSRKLGEMILATHPDAGKVTDPSSGLTPVMVAIKHGHVSFASRLLPYSPILHKDMEGKTILHHAVMNIHQENELGKGGTYREDSDFLRLIRQILKASRDNYSPADFVGFVNTLDRNAESALYFGAKRNKLRTVKLLMEYDAFISPMGGYRGKNALIPAIREGNEAMVRHLFSARPDRRPNFEWIDFEGIDITKEIKDFLKTIKPKPKSSFFRRKG